MDIDTVELEDLRFDREAQVEWVENSIEELDQEDLDNLFDWIIDEGKFDFLEILIELTLLNIEEPAVFREDLERIAPHIDGDLAWGKLYDEFRDRLDGREELSKEIHHELVPADDEWLVWMSGVALGQLNEEFVHEESLSILNSDDCQKIRAGIQAVIEHYQGQEVPPDIIEAFQELSNQDRQVVKQEIIRANAVLFSENESLWELTLDIGRENRELIPLIIERFVGKIEKIHLESFLDLLKKGEESGEPVELFHVSYFLHSRFSDQTDILVDYIIWLSEHHLYEAGRLTKEITKENQAFWSILDNRREDFEHETFAEQILSESEEYVDPEIAELTRLLESAFDESNSQTKGDLLEDAAEHLIGLIDDFEYARNVFATEEEIDILVHNRFNTHIQRWGTPILIECRNRAEKVQAKHVRDFEGKMQNHAADTGFFIARNGFTDGAVDQVKQCRGIGRENMIGMVTMEKLLELTESNEIVGLLVDKYDEINEL